MRTFIKIPLIIIMILTLSSCSTTKQHPFNPQAERQMKFVVVNTSNGNVAGSRIENGMSAFLGVPYAKPPKGDLRFAPPVAVESWDDVKPAIYFGPTCPQIKDEYEPSSLLYQDEDCLSLNIWTPGADDKKRPVIIYIHGGGFVNGGTGDPLYNGSYISKRGDIVFASVNYRVNALGYLYLEDFGPEFKGSGNIAIQDQLMGIRWIKNNIVKFGGDPDNITIMGESAGSASVMILMGLPQAKGLFNKAIAESGGCNLVRTRELASRYTKQFLKAAGVKDVASLRKLTPDEIEKAVEKQLDEAGFEADLVFAPVVDGSIIPIDPLKAIDSGSARGITFLNGTNHDEYRYWINYSGLLRFISMGVMLKAVPDVKAKLGGKDKELIEFYEKKNPHSGVSDDMFEFATDMMFLIPHIQATEAQSKYADVWMYRFDWKSQVKDYFGACHAIELPFVLKTFDSPTRWQIVGPNPPMNLSDMMMDAWVAFARTGNPNHAGIQNWPQYESGQRATMIFNTKSGVENDPEKDVRLIYKGITY
jgi:para-nitrobenzyl esterase